MYQLFDFLVIDRRLAIATSRISLQVGKVSVLQISIIAVVTLVILHAENEYAYHLVHPPDQNISVGISV